ncbi:hypothetical protein [uncultured Tateyamaria sp.]|uniref:hypothetical protein n=1 Tax=uncultured Tateyamaria sp. TaxID=455651 RepID=UPI00262177D1|nr:hypothetical protein [uncultured Tateyamaria sp.]
MMGRDGFVVFEAEPSVERWARAARHVTSGIAADPETQSANLRHGNTWFIGVDVLPNDMSGAVDGVPLIGPWDDHVPPLNQHPAQVSIIYPGYPKRDPDQSAANHGYRIKRQAAHVDGLLPEGPDRRRFAREFHAYILGIPLNPAPQAPTMIWPGSHLIMQRAIVDAIAGRDVSEVDLTDAYHAARNEVFAQIEPVPIKATFGQSFLIHRFALHGTAPWDGPDGPGRMIAFFRPEFDDPADWLTD